MKVGRLAMIGPGRAGGRCSGSARAAPARPRTALRRPPRRASRVRALGDMRVVPRLGMGDHRLEMRRHRGGRLGERIAVGLARLRLAAQSVRAGLALSSSGTKPSGSTRSAPETAASAAARSPWARHMAASFSQASPRSGSAAVARSSSARAAGRVAAAGGAIGLRLETPGVACCLLLRHGPLLAPCAQKKTAGREARRRVWISSVGLRSRA